MECGRADPLAKTWGWSTRVFCNEHLQIERIYAKAGGYSSIHRHTNKYNQFIVVEGRLAVHYFDDQCKHVTFNALHTGEHLIVPPGERHQFIAESAVQGYEVYWSHTGSVDPNDITRYSVNGLDADFKPPSSDEPVRYCAGCNRPFARGDLATVAMDNAIREVCPRCREPDCQDT